jgi:predicted DNA binding protein
LRSVALIDDLGDRGLFRAEWEPDHLGVMHAIAETGVIVVAATGSASGWTFQLRADDADSLSAFTAHCERHGIDVTLTRLSRLTDSTLDATTCGLTPEQREALVLAYEAGHYDEPRGAHLADLASRLAISRQAFAARLRRGYRNFVASAFVDDGPEDEA